MYGLASMYGLKSMTLFLLFSQICSTVLNSSAPELNGVVNAYHGMTFDLSGITTKSSGFEALFLELASVSGSSLASDSIVMS